MSDSNTSNPQDTRDDQGRNRIHELITAYIDNEIRDPQELKETEDGIRNDADLHNRFVFEKLTKKRVNESGKLSGPPLYLQKKIGEGIDEYIKKASARHSAESVTLDRTKPIQQSFIDENKLNLKRNLYIGVSVFVLLIAGILYITTYRDSGPVLASNDMVAVSRDVFNKIIDGKVPLQIKSSDAKVLADSMNKYLDFKVFVPDVKDAQLVGGTCNEINGEKLAHIIHKKGNVYIYTLQGNKDHILSKGSRIVLCKDFTEKVNNGTNWFTCLKEKTSSAVIWYKDNVICSSVAQMDSEDITAVLTNYSNQNK
ncbi:MAG: hypothetical protein K1X85_11925 [Ignavibacteria bacterium]|nr:hypothetical protein [Ignavibacteria bacterium]